ncbi:NAD-dependent deacetylase [Chitinimonas sp.]|uniref:SIR2 family NAD-dependent protein deacylase n=1 Tax=Chitinimonas sp. TaxID=1934313 RepID=UPI0035B1055A
MRPTASEQLARASALLEQADGLLVTAGAGMGVDSGLPDFRGNEGFWNAYPALGKQQIAFTSIANPQAFHDQPRLAWGFYGHRLSLYRQTRPHQGFQILRRWAERMQHGAFVFTSNVDGHFERAGFDAARIEECHGSIHYLQCLGECRYIWPADRFEPVLDTDRCLLTGDLPRCPICEGLARPNILMFNDWHWTSHRANEQRTRLAAWLGRVRAPVIVEIGAGVAIPSVRNFAMRVGCPIIRINPQDAATGTIGVGLWCGGLQGLQLLDATWAAQKQAG